MTKSPSPIRVYWDAAAFVAYLKEEPVRVDKCTEVLDAAERGEIIICTSALTLAEVVRGKHLAAVEIERSSAITDLFASEFIEVFGLDRHIAEVARELCWSCGNGLKPNDAIHVATACEASVKEFHSFNGRLNSLRAIADRVTFTLGEPRVANPVLRFPRQPSPIDTPKADPSSEQGTI